MAIRFGECEDWPARRSVCATGGFACRHEPPAARQPCRDPQRGHPDHDRYLRRAGLVPHARPLGAVDPRCAAVARSRLSPPSVAAWRWPAACPWRSAAPSRRSRRPTSSSFRSSCSGRWLDARPVPGDRRRARRMHADSALLCSAVLGPVPPRRDRSVRCPEMMVHWGYAEAFAKVFPRVSSRPRARSGALGRARGVHHLRCLDDLARPRA